MTLTPPTSGHCHSGAFHTFPVPSNRLNQVPNCRHALTVLAAFTKPPVTPAGNGGVIHRKLLFPCASGPSLGFCAVLLVGLRTGQRRAEAWRHAPTPPGSSGRGGALRPTCSPGTPGICPRHTAARCPCARHTRQVSVSGALIRGPLSPSTAPSP